MSIEDLATQIYWIAHECETDLHVEPEDPHDIELVRRIANTLRAADIENEPTMIVYRALKNALAAMGKDHLLPATSTNCAYLAEALLQEGVTFGGVKRAAGSVPEEARALLKAADKMRDDWAESDNPRKQELWQQLHFAADQLHEAIEGTAGA